jgi:hypothetical protein
MMEQRRWPNPVPERCAECGTAELDGLGPAGHWDSADRGGLLYAACCRKCGVKWLGYGWGSPALVQIIRWERSSDGEPVAVAT